MVARLQRLKRRGDVLRREAACGKLAAYAQRSPQLIIIKRFGQPRAQRRVVQIAARAQQLDDRGSQFPVEAARQLAEQLFARHVAVGQAVHRLADAAQPLSGRTDRFQRRFIEKVALRESERPVIGLGDTVARAVDEQLALVRRLVQKRAGHAVGAIIHRPAPIRSRRRRRGRRPARTRASLR